MLQSAEYNVSDQTLTATFPNGTVCHYRNVPASVVDELNLAESIGTEFNRLIKGGGYSYDYA